MKLTIITLAIVAAFLAGGTRRGVPAAGYAGQIQFNGGGILDASQNLTWDNENRTFTAGDWNSKANHTAIFIDDVNRCANLQCLGPLVIGDDGWGNSTRLIINDENQYASFNVPLILLDGCIIRSPNGHGWKLTVSDTGVISTTDVGAIN